MTETAPQHDPEVDQEASPEESVPNDAASAEISLEARIEDLEQQLEEMRNQALRALAETDNMRKRSEREKADATRYAITGFARDLLNVADTFSRALQVPPTAGDENGVKNFVLGVEMTETELQKVFEKQGIKKIHPLGEKFDHQYHQAMVEVETAEYEPGIVAQVMQEGYILHDRLLRPALVGVAKAPASPPPHIDTQV